MPECPPRGRPPVLLVFHQAGKRSTKNQMARVADLTCHEAAARTRPVGPVFRRFGGDHREPLLDAVGNSRRDAYVASRRQAAWATSYGVAFYGDYRGTGERGVQATGLA
ncbi:hypothetical protein AB0O67_01565 [Streptomyces sp. NPDC086077]|uniref:hypothetical protein n=1 Tax=Streptomyces sp. NPDC086077 TaxID=3154862 RepID=UPI00342159B0